MADSGQVVVRDDYFYCSICLEIFDKPRTLPCLHSFCQECLKGYILKIKEKTGKQQLFCPICRADTKTYSVKFKQVEKWVEYFPINFTLLSILKDRKLTMNPKGNDCESCLSENIKVDATVYCYNCSEKLCEDCKRYHRKNKSSTNHRLTDTSDKEEESNTDLVIAEYLANLTKCPTHETKQVKYLCKDHYQLCCNECAIVTHRKCEDIVSLAEEAMKNEEIDESNVQKRLDTVESYVENLIKHETTYLANVHKKENEVKDCLKNLKAKLNVAYDKLEQRITLKFSDRKQALSKSSSLQRESAEKLKECVKEAGQKIKKAKSMGTNLHVFLLEREMSKQITQYEETFTTLRDKSSKAEIALSVDISFEETVRKIGDLYQIEEVEREQHLPTISQTNDFKKRKLTLEREVNLNESKPGYCLWMGNYIVVSFRYSSKLVAYKANNGSTLSSYQCSSPTSVTAIENGEFAVALPKLKKIHIMKIEKNQIVCLRQFSCPKPDIIAYNSKDKHLLTFSRSKMLLRKITLTGSDAGFIDLKQIEKSYQHNSFNLFVDSQYGHIFLSAYYHNKLRCFDMFGNLKFLHKTDHPLSVITDSQGNVYVLAGNTRHYIQQLCPKGQIINSEIIGFDKVVRPIAMSFNKEMNKLVITSTDVSVTGSNVGCIDGSVKMKIYNFQ